MRIFWYHWEIDERDESLFVFIISNKMQGQYTNALLRLFRHKTNRRGGMEICIFSN